MIVLFRHASIRTLWFIGCASLSVVIILYTLFSSRYYWDAQSLEETYQQWHPSQQALANEIAAFTGSWPEQFQQRSGIAFLFAYSRLPYFHFLARQRAYATGHGAL